MVERSINIALTPEQVGAIRSETTPQFTLSQSTSQFTCIEGIREKASAFIREIHQGILDNPGIVHDGDKVRSSDTFPIGPSGDLTVSVAITYKERAPKRVAKTTR